VLYELDTERAKKTASVRIRPLRNHSNPSKIRHSRRATLPAIPASGSGVASSSRSRFAPASPDAAPHEAGVTVPLTAPAPPPYPLPACFARAAGAATLFESHTSSTASQFVSLASRAISARSDATCFAEGATAVYPEGCTTHAMR